MERLPTPHGDKLVALLENVKLPEEDSARVQHAFERYHLWIGSLAGLEGASQENLEKMVDITNQYKSFIDIDLIFDSKNDFLYRQKGQLKLDNTITEEFLPILVTNYFSEEFSDLELLFGPTKSFSGLRFESYIGSIVEGGGLEVRSKNQDFAISRKLYIRTSHYSDFREELTKETNIAYVATECKTNLDKTMFQEAAATALDVKTSVPSAKYFLMCEWLDMTPINTATTAIDEVIILRKTKRISSNIRSEFNTYEGRTGRRDFYVDLLNSYPLAIDSFGRFISQIGRLMSEEGEDEIMKRGYF